MFWSLPDAGPATWMLSGPMALIQAGLDTAQTLWITPESDPSAPFFPPASQSWIREEEFPIFSSSRKIWCPGSQPLADNGLQQQGPSLPCRGLSSVLHGLDAGQGSKSSGRYLSTSNIFCLWNPFIFSPHIFQILQLMRLGPYTQ